MPVSFFNQASQRRHGRRLFYQIPFVERSVTDDNHPKEDVSVAELVEFVSQDVIGRDHIFSGPFGLRKILYCDYIASGRALRSIESYILESVLPLYGNTHTSTTVTSLQSSMFLEEARMNFRNAVRASEYDAVIFTGNGVTGAVHKLIHALDFQESPVVFVGPYEHHSNLLPWREIAAHIIPITENADGTVNVAHLELALKEWKLTGLQLIGCFSAASNITGIVADTIEISQLLHQYNALAFWDFATAGPYVNIDMHPSHSEGDASMDAIFLSMHKFIGGVDAPGVLVAKRSLFRNNIPSGGGGGSVFFVSRDSHRYLKDEETREEGGSPRVVGIVRAALAMELKQSIGPDSIMKREEQLYREVMKVWRDCSNLHVLGQCEENKNVTSSRIAVFSIMISFPGSNLFLHHNFVSALLNDMFGIQARGGCACAGPYAQELLGIDMKTALRFEQALLEDSRLDRTHLRRRGEYSSHEVLRPGFVRLNFPYFASQAEVTFIIKAIAMVAEHGSKLLPQYMFNSETGEWNHTKHKRFEGRRWLGHTRFSGKGLVVNDVVEHDGDVPKDYDDLLNIAESIFLSPMRSNESLPDHRLMFNDDVQDLRWFVVPSEAQLHNLGKISAPNTSKCPLSIRVAIHEHSLDILHDLVKIPVHVASQLARLNMAKLKEEKKANETSASINGNSISEVTFEKMPLQKSPDVLLHALNQSNANFVESSTCVLPSSTNAAETNNELVCNPPKKLTKRNSHCSAAQTRQGYKFISPSKRLFKLTLEAIDEFRMIESGDRVLVCLSGGKDSLSLLHVLHQYQFYAKSKKIDFELGAVTIDPMTSSYDPSPLIPYLKELETPYFYEEQDILHQALEVSASSICSFCSRMKRGRIYACARREGWNVLAFGQHLDDLAESFLMSAFHNGLLRTMKASYTVKEGDLRVIRPFIYVRETDTRQFAEAARLPVIPENCPACFEAPKERHRMKQLLASQEILHPRLFYSLKEAMMPLLSKNRTGLESNVNQSERFMNCTNEETED